MTPSNRYKTTRKSGEPYTCRFCGAVVMVDIIYSRNVNLDETPHKCERKRKHFSQQSADAQQARRNERIAE